MAADGEDYSAMKVFELQSELHKRGLSTSGKKALLVKRLQQDDAASAPPPPAKKATKKKAPAKKKVPAKKATPVKKAKKAKEESEEEEEEEDDDEEPIVDTKTNRRVIWQWAGDSAKGSQDVWIDYDPATATKLEDCLLTKRKPKRRQKVDPQRFVDMTDTTYWQRRYDDPQGRMRLVRRRLGKKVAQAVEEEESESEPEEEEEATATAPQEEEEEEEKEEEEEEEEEETVPPTTAAVVAAVPPDEDEIMSSEDEEEEEEEEEAEEEELDASYVHWFWAGDSPGPPMGHQDMWVAYSKKFCQQLEAGFVGGKKRVDADTQRFVDLQNMLQRRKDDPNRRRMVKRIVPAGYVAKTTKNALQKVTISGGKISKASAVKFKALQQAIADEDDEADDEEDESEEEIVKPAPKGKGKGKQKAKLAGKKRPREDDSDEDKAPPTKATKSSDDDEVDSPSGIQFDFPSAWQKQATLDLKEVPVPEDSHEFQMLHDMFTSTVDKGHTGSWAGNHKVKFNTLEVSRVVRIQNPMLWLRYKHRKETIFNAAKSSIPPVFKVLTGSSTDPSVNEYFLFHGLNENFIPGICRFGFDPRFCSLKGMFGAGIYFAEHSSKANQYCHGGNCTASGFIASGSQLSCKCTKSGEAVMLVCRVTLGDTLVEKQYRGNYNPTDYWFGRRTEPDKPNGGIFNGVIGESKKNGGSDLVYREYVVYESSQVYPEYVVYFKRK